MKIVEIEWLDAHVSTSSTTIQKAEKIKPVVTRTVGYLVSENEEGIVMATDRYPKHPKEAKIINFVPWDMITEYYEIVLQ